LKHLSEAQVEQYFELGYCSPIDVMLEHEILELKNRLEQAEQNYPESIHSENRNNAHLVFPFLDQITRHPVIVDSVEDLLGPDIQLWGSVLFSKEPQSAGYVSWHQDATYMGLFPHDFVTPWLALTHSNPDSGCMRVIPGSHRDPILPHTDTFESNNILTRGQEIIDIDYSKAVDLILRPGQMSIHHPRLVHGSSPNRSRHRRIGLALQSYVAPGVEQVAGKGYATHIRGSKDKFSFELGPHPRHDMDQVCVAWRKKVNQNLSEILYRGAAKKRAY
jgi:non-haem Fe2+, alpha-ketoglutarate-dependent halogenase